MLLNKTMYIFAFFLFCLDQKFISRASWADWLRAWAVNERRCTVACLVKHFNRFLILRKIVGAFNKEKALGLFSGHCEPSRRLVDSSTACVRHVPGVSVMLFWSYFPFGVRWPAAKHKLETSGTETEHRTSDSGAGHVADNIQSLRGGTVISIRCLILVCGMILKNVELEIVFKHP